MEGRDVSVVLCVTLNSVVQAISRWGIDYVVLTSVDRDDLEDGGANHFASTVELIKAAKPDMLVECLVSDFRGEQRSVDVSRRGGLCTSRLLNTNHDVLCSTSKGV